MRIENFPSDYAYFTIEAKMECKVRLLANFAKEKKKKCTNPDHDCHERELDLMDFLDDWKNFDFKSEGYQELVDKFKDNKVLFQRYLNLVNKK